jgi:preprotein translocase subunit SecF
MSIFSRLYNGETAFRFVPRWKLWFAVSGAVIVIGAVGLLTRGLNLGIDFEGGVAWESPAGHATVAQARAAVEGAGVTDPTVQSLGSSVGNVIRVQAESAGGTQRQDVTAALAKVTGSSASTVSFSEVGPSWGDEITKKARNALFVFLLVVTIYITIRFELRMALATLAALVHDIFITVGIYAVFGLPVTPATVIAFLTILGYSIYDGIVVFDRVDENAKALEKSGATTYSAMVNTSMNEVLMRSLNTSITALLPIGSLLVVGSLILGATSLEEFALALFIGLLSGAYSSIFIASPLLALLKEREPRWQALRQRLEAGAAPRPVAVSATVASGAASAPGAGPMVEDMPRPAAERAAIQARARKKGRRR